MLLADLVAVSAAVAADPGRKSKVARIAALLARVPQDQTGIAVAFLSGDLTQRQIGVGYAALADLLGWQPARWPSQARASVPELTLERTDAVLGAIGDLRGPGSQGRRRELLGELLERATAAEQEFLARLIGGDLRQGAQEGVMTDAVALAVGVRADEVRRAHQLCGSLPAVAQAALAAVREGGDPLAVLRAVSLRVGQPVRPMLAASAPSLEAALARISPAALEWKIDGIRIQVHRHGERVRVFTRTLDDITARVPEIAELARSMGAAELVADGEAVSLWPDGRPRPFQVTSARVASHAGAGTGTTGSGTAPASTAVTSTAVTSTAGTVPLTAFLFDLLRADGEDLIDAPASVRFARLAQITPAAALIPRLVTADPATAAGFFADAVARGHEGVVVKSLDAPYRTGRRGSDWIKVKPRHTLDLVILAAEWGHGRRQGLLSNLHLGARDPAGGFVMLGKTFKGLTDDMLTWQTARLLGIAQDPERWAPLRAGAVRGQATGLRGVVRVRPELVAEIAFDGVQSSSRYPGGVTLRFARVLRYRPDKVAAEADTIGTVRSLRANADAGQPNADAGQPNADAG